MSGYAYDYSLSPARPTGWGSTLTTVVAIIAVVAVSTISGAVVTLELIAPPPQRADSALAAVATRPASNNSTSNSTSNNPTKIAATNPIKSTTASVATRESAPMPRVESPRETASVSPRETASIIAPVRAQPQAPAPAAAQTVAQGQSASQSKPPLTVASVPAAAPTAQAAPIDVQARVPDRDLTFAKGYAQRQAAQKAAAQGAPAAKVATLNQFGRSATVPPKPKVIARVDPRLDPRRTREEGFWSDRSDFERHQALAFGDPRQSRRPPPPAPGPFGLFDRLF